MKIGVEDFCLIIIINMLGSLSPYTYHYYWKDLYL